MKVALLAEQKEKERLKKFDKEGQMKEALLAEQRERKEKKVRQIWPQKERKMCQRGAKEMALSFQKADVMIQEQKEEQEVGRGGKSTKHQKAKTLTKQQ